MVLPETPSSRFSSIGNGGLLRTRRVAARLLRTPFNRVLGIGLWAVASMNMPLTADAINGRALFVTNCAPCHGADGEARTPIARKLKVKDLSLSALKDAEIREQILDGKRGKRKAMTMPSFKDRLSAEEIQALVKVVRSFRKSE
jgi:mono/diheme cytochrome c family protein